MFEFFGVGIIEDLKIDRHEQVYSELAEAQLYLSRKLHVQPYNKLACWTSFLSPTYQWKLVRHYMNQAVLSNFLHNIQPRVIVRLNGD